jgi:hypothetical protein
MAGPQVVWALQLGPAGFSLAGPFRLQPQSLSSWQPRSPMPAVNFPRTTELETAGHWHLVVAEAKHRSNHVASAGRRSAAIVSCCHRTLGLEVNAHLYLHLVKSC